jgi:hypothetical protein
MPDNNPPGTAPLQNSEINYGPTLLPADSDRNPIENLTPRQFESPINTSGLGGGKDFYSNLDSSFDNLAQKQDYLKQVAPQPFAAEPMMFDRYASSWDFSKRGFIPWRDNESVYNADTSFLKEMYRSTKWSAPIFGQGFVAGARLFPDLIEGAFSGDWDKVFRSDDYLADKWDRATKMGTSSVGGLSTFFTGLEVSVANMVGTLTEMAVENQILAYITAATDGAAAPATITIAAERNALGFKSIYEGIKNIGKITDIFKDAEVARTFYKTALLKGENFGKGVVDFINPFSNTLGGFKEAGFLQNISKTGFARGRLVAEGTLGATAAGNTVRGFGAFYKDVREVNFALTEAKLEGGFNKLQRRDNYVNDYMAKNNGRLPTGEELKDIEASVKKSSDAVTIANLPVIYYTNRLGFGNMFKGYAPISKMMSEASSGGLFKWIEFNSAKKIFEETSKLSLKRSARLGVGKSLNYFKANFMEGVQENLQDVIQGASTDYYDKQFKSPNYGGMNVMMSDALNQFGSQVFSGQGVETFLGGFVMGAIPGSVQKVGSKINDLSTRLINKEKYQEYKDTRKKQIETYVNTLNDVYSDPLKFFDPKYADAVKQGDYDFYLRDAASRKNQKEFQDIKDQSVYSHLYTLVRSGKSEIIKDRLEEFKQLKPEEFKEVLGYEVEDHKNFKNYIDTQIKKVDEIQALHDKSHNKIINPVNLSAYKKDTEEYKDAAIQFMAFENARQQALFANYSFMRNGERMLGLMNKMQSSKLFVRNTSYVDFSTLTSETLLDNEIDVLEKEIKALEAGDADSKKIAKEKSKRLTTLTLWKNTIGSEEIKGVERDKDGNIKESVSKFPKDYPSEDNPAYENWRRLAKLAFERHVQTSADISKDSVYRESVDEVFDYIMDYHTLNKENSKLVEAVNILADPKEFLKLYEGNYTFMKEAYEKRAELIRNSIQNALTVSDENELINKLILSGFIEDPENPGSYLKLSDDQITKVDPDSEDYKKIQEIIKDHEALTKQTTPEEQPTTQTQTPAEEEPEEEEVIPDEAGKMDVYKSEQPYINPVHQIKPREIDVKTVRDSSGNIKYFEWNFVDSDIKTKETKFATREAFEKYLDLVLLQDYVKQLSSGKFKDTITFKKGIPQKGVADGYDVVFNKPFSSPDNFIVDISSLSDGEKSVAFGEPYTDELISKSDVQDFKDIRVGVLGLINNIVTAEITKVKAAAEKAKRTTGNKFITSVRNPVVLFADTIEEKEAFRDAVMNNSKEEFDNNVTIKLVKQTPQQKELAGSTDNIKVFRNTLGISIQVLFKGKPIGYLTHADVYSFNFYGTAKSVSDLTQKEYNSIAEDAAGTLENFKLNYAASRLIYDTLSATLGTKNEITITNDAVKDLIGFDLRMGGYEFTGETTRPLSNLESKTTKLIGIYDKINLEKQIAGAALSKEQTENSAFFEEALASFSEKTAKQGRYIAVYRHNNGQFSYVEIKTPKLTETNMTDLFVDIQDQMEKTRSENIKQISPTETTIINNQFNAAFNNKINNDLFIAFNPNERGLKGLYATIGITPNGDIKIQFTDSINKKNHNVFVKVDYTKDNKLKSINGIDRLLREINFAINNFNSDPKNSGVNLPVIDKEMLRGSLPKVSSFTQLKSQVTNVSENIHKSPTGYYYPKSSANPSSVVQTQPQQQAAPVVQPTAQPIITPAPAAPVSTDDKAFKPNAEQQKLIDDELVHLNEMIEWEKGRTEVDEERKERRIKSWENKLNDLKTNPVEYFINSYKSGVSYYERNNNPEKAKAEQEKLDYWNNVKAGLQKTTPTTDAKADIKAKKADIERRRQEALNSIELLDSDSDSGASLYNYTIDGKKFQEMDRWTVEKEINAKYDAELAALEGGTSIQQTAPEPPAQTQRKKRSLGINLASRPVTEPVSKEDIGDTASTPDPVMPTTNQFQVIKNKYKDLLADLKGKKDSKLITKDQYVAQTRILEANEKAELDKLSGKSPVKSLKRGSSKITEEEFSGKDVENIAVFSDWIVNNLPDIFTVEEIYTIAEKLSGNKVRMGRFMAYVKDVKKGLSGIRGEIQVGQRYKYHEAFHAVFQLLLTDEQIERVLKAAEYEVNQNLRAQNKTMDKALEEFRELYSEEYADLTKEELKERFLEEHLADRFDSFKNQTHIEKNENIIFKAFRKLKEFINRLLNRNNSTDTIKDLFTNIDSGKFKNVNVQNNRYTNQLLSGVPVIEAFKIKYDTEWQQNLSGNMVAIDKYLSESDTQKLVGALVNSFIYREGKLSVEEKRARFTTQAELRDAVLDEIINDFGKLYNPENTKYDDLSSNQLDRLLMFDKVFNGDLNQSALDALKETANLYLDLMGYSQSQEEVDDEWAIRDDQGDRRSTESYEDAYSKGGLISLPSFVRRYIQTTGYQETDEFGNTMLDEASGEPLVFGVNSGIIYNGMVKAMSGVTTEEKFIRRMYHFMEENDQTRAFINKFIIDTGLTFNSQTGEYSILNNPQLFMSVFKAFTLHQTDYHTLLVGKVGDNKNKIHVKWMQANRQDAAKNQFNRWQWHFMSRYQDVVDRSPELKTQMLTTIDDLKRAFGDTAIEDADLNNFINGLNSPLKQFAKISGISLSRKFFAYSIASHLVSKDVALTEEQQELYNSFSDVNPLTLEDLVRIKQTIDKGLNPFLDFRGSLSVSYEEEEDNFGTSNDEEIEDDRTDEEKKADKEKNAVGEQGRLIKIASNNAIFDETVLATSWLNPEKKTVYAHQQPTFHLSYVQDVIKNEVELRKLVESDPFLQDTFMGKQIMNGEGIVKILRNIKVTRLAGQRQVQWSDNLTENKRNKANQRDGKTYGKYGAQEFLLTMLHQYLQNERIIMKDKTDVVTSRHLIRVLEASSTGDTVNLEVIQSVYTNPQGRTLLSEQAKNYLLDEFMSEYNRITRTQKEIDQIDAGTFTGAVIENYHNGDIKKSGMRGVRFRSFESILGSMAESLQASARKGLVLTDKQKVQVADQIEKGLLGDGETMGGEVGTFLETLADFGIVYKSERNNRYIGKLMDDRLKGDPGQTTTKESLDRLNLRKGNMEHNMAQVFINDFLNTMSFNKLLLGDQAMSLKDFIDAVKRAKGANGAGANLRSGILAPELGINHTFTESFVTVHKNSEYQGKYSGKTQDRADAQMWATAKGFRYIQHSLGRLDKNVAAFLDKIERGEELKSTDIFGEFGSLKYNAQTSVLKVVYYDGKSYIKTSMLVLSKRFTSRLTDVAESQRNELLALRKQRIRGVREAMINEESRAKVDEAINNAVKNVDRRIDTLLRDNNNYVAQKGMELLHNKRVQLEAFEAKGRVGFSVPESAAKGLKQNVSSDLENFNVEDKGYTKLDNRYWRLQVENPTNKVFINDPTQARQIIDTEQDDDVIVHFYGEDITVGQLKNMYQEDTARRVRLKYIGARNRIFSIKDLDNELSKSINAKKITPNLAEFQEMALQNLKNMGSTGQLYEFFKVDTDPRTGIKTPKFDLNHPYTRTKFVQLFLSYFRNDVLSEKVPGSSLTLASDFGVNIIKRVTKVEAREFTDANGNKVTRNVPVAWDYIMREHYLKDANFYDTRAKDFKENLEEHDLKVGDFFVDRLRYNVQEYDENGNKLAGRYYSEMMTAAHHKAMMEIDYSTGVPRIVNKGFTVRIPSQDKHSFMSIRTVDFLPANYGSTGIFARELIELSGADFDVDKAYTQFVDFYTTKNEEGNVEFHAYGDATTKEDKRMEYITWNLKNNKLIKRKINELKRIKSPEDTLLYPDETFDDYEDTDDILLDLIETSRGDIITRQAFKEANIPYTQAEYDQAIRKYGEINIGVLNNRILEAKIALLTNDSQKGVATQVANLKALEDVLEDAKIKPGVIEEKNIDPDNLNGKIASFVNNKEGQDNIAPAVNGMLSYTFLNKYKIKFRDDVEEVYKFIVDNHHFNTYGESKAGVFDSNGKFKGYTGNRIMNTVSAIVTAMTDNAKERLARKLNLTFEGVAIASDLVSRGVPLDIVVGMFLNPAIKDYFEEIKSIRNGIKLESDDYKSKTKIGKELLLKYKSEAGVDAPLPLTSKMIFDSLNTNSAIANYSILYHILNVSEQSEYFNAVSQILKLSKGPGTDFEYSDDIRENLDLLGDGLSNSDFAKTEIPFDVRDALRKKHLISSTYLRIADQMEVLQKKLFIERTDLFNVVSEGMLNQLSIRPADFKRVKASVRNNLITYIGLRGYLKKLSDQSSELIPLLDNKLIYDGDPDYDNVVTILKVAANEDPSNYLLNNFLNVFPSSVMQEGQAVKNEKNSTGINLVEGNTWGKIDSYMLDKLQNSFTDLYTSGNEKLRMAALALFAYAVVKDGTQFKSNSLMPIIPPYMFDDLFAEIMPNVKEIFSDSSLVEALKKDSAYLNDFKEVFGDDFKGMVADFYKAFISHVSNSFYIKKIQTERKKEEPKSTKISDASFKLLNADKSMTITYNKDLNIEDGMYKITNRDTNEVLEDLVSIKKLESESENEFIYELVVEPPVQKSRGPIEVSENGETLNINIFRDVAELKLETFLDIDSDEYVEKWVKKNTKAPLEKDEKNRLAYNIGQLKRRGFRVEKDAVSKKIKVELPFRFSIKSGERGATQYYELSEVKRTSKDSSTLETINLKEAFTDDFRLLASTAVYKLVKQRGSYSTSPVGEMFGSIPEYTPVVKEKLSYRQQKFLERVAEGPRGRMINEVEWANAEPSSKVPEPQVKSNTVISTETRDELAPEFTREEFLEDYSQTTGEVIGAQPQGTNVKDQLKSLGFTFRMNNKEGKINYKKNGKTYDFSGTPQQLLDSLTNKTPEIKITEKNINSTPKTEETSLPLTPEMESLMNKINAIETRMEEGNEGKNDARDLKRFNSYLEELKQQQRNNLKKQAEAPISNKFKYLNIKLGDRLIVASKNDSNVIGTMTVTAIENSDFVRFDMNFSDGTKETGIGYSEKEFNELFEISKSSEAPAAKPKRSLGINFQTRSITEIVSPDDISDVVNEKEKESKECNQPPKPKK